MSQLPSHRALQHIAIQDESIPTPRWTSLPPELRRMILQFLADASTSEERPIANFASVSKEWQNFFEPLLWQKLTFRPHISRSNFQGFREVIQSHRKSLLGTICLDLKLEEYFCHRCRREIGGQHAIIANQRYLYKNLKKLLSILSCWTEDIPERGLSLELRGFSAPSEYDMELSVHGRSRCVHRRSPTVRDEDAEADCFRDVVFSYRPLARAPVITAISISPTITWSCSSFLIFMIRTSFPRLRQFDYEQQLGRRRTGQQGLANEFVFLTATAVSSVRRLSFFESRRKDIPEAEHIRISEEANDLPPFLPQVVNQSFCLKELAITSHGLDARKFFSHFNSLISSGEKLPSCILERLVLSCQLEELPVNPREVECLLVAASQAATHMPCLKMLEVWSPGVGEGFFFRYEVEESEINFTMAATWQFDIMSWQTDRKYKALRAWEKVASRHKDRRFNCTIETIDAGDLPKLYRICTRLKSKHFIRKWQPEFKTLRDPSK